jgi:ribosome-associated translation inhibitor RaiA
MIEIQGIPKPGALHQRVSAQIAEATRQLRVGAAAVRVTFVDVNGPKGGGSHCAITVPVPGTAAIHVEHVARTPRLAFDGAFAALEARVLRKREARRDRARYPKKYFVATHLAPGAPAPEESAS